MRIYGYVGYSRMRWMRDDDEDVRGVRSSYSAVSEWGRARGQGMTRVMMIGQQKGENR